MRSALMVQSRGTVTSTWPSAGQGLVSTNTTDISTRAPASSSVGLTCGGMQKGGHMPVKLPGAITMPLTARSSSIGVPVARSVRTWKVPVTPACCGLRTWSRKSATRTYGRVTLPSPPRETVTSTSECTRASRCPPSATSASYSEAIRRLPASRISLPTATATEELKPTLKPSGSTTAMRQSGGRGLAGTNSTSSLLRVPAVASTMLTLVSVKEAVISTKPGTARSWSMRISDDGSYDRIWKGPVGPEKFWLRMLVSMNTRGPLTLPGIVSLTVAVISDTGIPVPTMFPLSSDNNWKPGSMCVGSKLGGRVTSTTAPASSALNSLVMLTFRLNVLPAIRELICTDVSCSIPT
mmetsp:Transcript_64915/g.135351  ORF Transcript_64915/g.135351 Transcript_64915/m.135351 type:complete len:352 (+) Transcript_64915:2455-3510(+)